MSKTVAVFTVTGEQGSSVAKSLLKAGWNVLGFTRSTTSESAKALEKLGVQLAQADFNDPSSYASHLKGVDAAYVNADFWAIYLNNGYNGEAAQAAETKQAKDAVDACEAAGVGHIVYSTLDGGMGCAHWDSKYAVTEYIEADAKLSKKTTNLFLAFYFSNLTRLGLLSANDDGSFTLGLPAPDSTKIAGLGPEQTGLWVRAALENPEEWKGKRMYGTTDAPTVGEMVKTLSELSGKTVKTSGMTDDVFLSDGFQAKLGKEMWAQWKLFYDGNPPRDIAASRKVAPEAYDFRDWAKNSDKLKELLGF